MEETQNIHASCLCMAGSGVLLLGPSGSGKSDLALRLLQMGPADADAVLVADDRVIVSRNGAELQAKSTNDLKGLIEVRGFGIVSLPFQESCRIDLAVSLQPAAQIDRLPEDFFGSYRLLDVEIAHMKLDAMAASAPARLWLAVRQLQTSNCRKSRAALDKGSGNGP